MSEHSKTPWRVFTSPDGLKLVGIGTQEGEGILDSGFGVWSWNDPEGIANANMVVKAVNAHTAMVKVLEECLREHGGFTIRGDCERNARAALALATIKETS